MKTRLEEANNSIKEMAEFQIMQAKEIERLREALLEIGCLDGRRACTASEISSGTCCACCAALEEKP